MLTSDELKNVLKTHWGYSDFREPQLDIIQAFLEGNDVIVLLPTGAGKSVCYQIPAIVSQKPYLIISPLIALMEDQTEALNRRGIPAAALHSGLEKKDQQRIMRLFIKNRIKLLYVSPERIQSPGFLESIKSSNVGGIAIDEAHCISQWGHDFRPSYLKLERLKEYFPDANTMALTASATPWVQAEIAKTLGMKNHRIFFENLRRKNLCFHLMDQSLPVKALKKILVNIPRSTSGIIYLRNRIECERLAKRLSHLISCDFYHAGLDFQQRQIRQEKWKSGIINWMIATNAFGMGIDKADVRYVIHIGLPPNIEEYVQETGRAGRDGKQSECLLLYNDTDIAKQKMDFERKFPPLNDVKSVCRSIIRYVKSNHIALQERVEGSSFKSLPGIELRAKAVLLEACLDHLYNFGMDFRFLKEEKDLKVKLVADTCLIQSLKQDDSNFLRQLLALFSSVRNRFVDLSSQQIAGELGLTRSSFIEQLFELEKQNVIEMVREPRKFSPMNLPGSPMDFRTFLKYYRLRRKIAYRQLNRIIWLLTSLRCRQAYIQGYFGQTEGSACGECDNCKKQDKRKMPSTGNVVEDIRKRINHGAIKLDHLVWQWPYYQRGIVATALVRLESERELEIDKEMVIRKVN